MWTYDDSRAALRDALRLSRAMTFKAAVAGLPLGGGKGVIMLRPARPALAPSAGTAVLLDFADTVDALGGRYLTAEDVGTRRRDMSVIAGRTRHVTGLPRSAGGSGDPSPLTALGVEVGDRACCERAFGTAVAARAARSRDRPRPRRRAAGRALRPGGREARGRRRRPAQARAGRAARRALGDPGEAR